MIYRIFDIRSYFYKVYQHYILRHITSILNDKVKHRQWYRPFAPSILREEVSNWFDREVDSPYMSFCLKFKEDMKDKVPAVLHFDGTARLQTVSEKDNKWYQSPEQRMVNHASTHAFVDVSFVDCRICIVLISFVFGVSD